MDDIFFTATGEEDGYPMLFRSQKIIPEGIVESDYPNLISIYWDFDMSESGMPDEETNDLQVNFEIAIESLDVQETSFMMLVVTGNGRKEWHWYAKNTESWMEKFNKALQGFPKMPFEILLKNQPNWDLYKNFLAGVKGLE